MNGDTKCVLASESAIVVDKIKERLVRAVLFAIILAITISHNIMEPNGNDDSQTFVILSRSRSFKS